MNFTWVFNSYSAFLDRPDKTINGVSAYHAADNPNYENDNVTNIGCWNCVDCFGCVDCVSCVHCMNCTRCFDCENCKNCIRSFDYTQNPKT